MNGRAERLAKAFEVPLLVAALLVIPVIAIEQSSASDSWKRAASILNWAIWLAFAAELVAMLAVVPNRRRWLREHPLELTIVVLTPPFLPRSLQAARAFRLLRLVRLLWVMQLLRRLFTVEGLRYAALLAAMTALGGGAAFADVENHSTWNGVYWAITTMTTVGYGDITPKTDGGKAIAVVVMLIGIGFVTLVIGAIAQRFLAGEVEEIREAEEEITGDLATVEATLRELSEVMGRLQRVETAVQKLAGSRPGGGP